MSCRAFHNVLALLDHDESATWSVLSRAIEIAEVERARLTIAKTTDPGRIVKWFLPLAMMSRVAPVTEMDIEALAREVDRACECVPDSVPLKRVVLDTDTASALRTLMDGECYDLLVVREGFADNSRAVWKEIRRRKCCALIVCPQPSAESDLLAWGADGERVPRSSNARQQEAL
jgi:hypothetical protein